MTTLLLILSLLLSPRPPELSARWLDSTHAELRWQSSAETVCIDRLPASGGRVFLDCYAGSGVLRLPAAGPNDYAYFPAEGDRYVAWFDEVRVEVALVRGYSVYLPLVKKQGQDYAVSLPLVMR